MTVVGGKLTTYRRMAQDAVDAAVDERRPERPAVHHCSTPTRRRGLPHRAGRLTAESASPRLVRRYGADAELVLANAREVSGLTDEELLAPVADGVPVTLAELLFGITHEGAHDVADLLDRRTRVGLVGERPSARGAGGAPRIHARQGNGSLNRTLGPPQQGRQALPSMTCSSPGGRTQACHRFLRRTFPPVL